MAYIKRVGTEGFVRFFSELSNKDVAIAGGKGASLAEMYNNGFPVPPGFIITAEAFDYFISKNGIKDRIREIILEIDMENTEELDEKSAEIRRMIEDSEIPEELEKEILEAYHFLGTEKISRGIMSDTAYNILKNSYEPVFVAVRSSATTEDLGAASFAGAGESFVNTKGDRQLLINVKKCFSSLYTARGIYYRKRQGFGVDKVESYLAAVVQKMVDSEKSGVVFSRDPVTQEDNIIIEAVFGLGEGIVSGKINPDNYIVSRNLKINSIRIAEKKIALTRSGGGENITVRLNPEKSKSQVLTTSEIMQLANYAIKLEEHYRKPQDIEFAVEEGKVFIVQSRPITTLGEKKKEQTISGNVILNGSGASPGIGVGTVRIIGSMKDLPKIKKGDVLVTEMTNPDMVVAMQKSVAIVTDEGGMTSHAAIVSREMGIPAVVGTGNATSVLRDGMKITVDGGTGKIYEGAVAENKFVEIKQIIPVSKIKLKLILDLPDFVERAAESGIRDVGLQRIEGIIAESGKHPLVFEKEEKLDEYERILINGISKIAKHFDSIWVRTSDIRSDEFGDLKGSPEKEMNPMLGFHGIRFSLKHPGIFDAEMSAIAKVASEFEDKKFGVMFPQVISVEEVKMAREFFDRYKTGNMEFGVMIETPAAVQVIEDICKEGINFISFGTNDLTQFTLAIDRGNEDVQYLYNELNPAIFSQIKRVISVCKRYNVKTSICGQAGSKPEMAEFLFEQGIDSISVNADAGYAVSELIHKLENEKSRTTENKSVERKENWEKENKDNKEYNAGEVEYKKQEERKEKQIQYERPEGSHLWSKSKWKRWKKKYKLGWDKKGSLEVGLSSKIIKRENEKAPIISVDSINSESMEEMEHLKEKGEYMQEQALLKDKRIEDNERLNEPLVEVEIAETEENETNYTDENEIREDFSENNEVYGEDESDMINENEANQESIENNMSITELLDDIEAEKGEKRTGKGKSEYGFDEYSEFW